MEGDPTGHEDVHAAIEALREKLPDGKLGTCPWCGSDTWQPARDLIVSPGLWANAEAGAGPEPISALQTLILICSGCAFLRMHLVEGEADD